MKKTLISFLALLLALLAVLGGCSDHGETMITAGGTEISVNVFQLYLSRMKGTIAAAGENVSDPTFWATYTSLDGQTYGDYYTAKVLEGLKQIAAALCLYEEYGLTLKSEDEAAIDEWINALIEEVGEGSETKLNSVLSAYGANITVLRDACIIEAKINQLKEYLYGKEGSLLSPMAKEEFYQQTYYRGYQMLIANYYYDHEKDADGNAVYYVTNKAADGTVSLTGKISYDTVNGTATDKTDANGDVIYRLKKEDGSFGAIAYDKEKGGLKYFYDKNGEHILKYYTDAQMKDRYAALELIAEECKNNEALFLERAQAYSDNSAFNEKYAPNGMYFSAGGFTNEAVFQTFANELAKLEVGELAILTSDSGYYLLMRAELDTGAWSDADNERWFQTMNGLAVEYMLQKRTEPYLQQIVVDEALAGTVDITMVAANNYY